MIQINIAEDFSATPGGRFKKDGPYSGEEFRDTILIPKYEEAVATNDILRINLDGCFGYPSSFLDESFGGLAIYEKSKEILNNIELICMDDPKVLDDIGQFIKDAKIKE